MRRPTFLLALVALVALAVVVPAFAQTDLTGQTETGAYFSIRVPDGWQPADGLGVR